jgi:acyl-CoA thioester hydrolase
MRSVDKTSDGVTVAVARGAFIDHAHHFPIEVNFEDVDVTGVVHHPKYLNFMERARSDALRLLEIDHRAAVETGIGYFAVADIQIKYIKPAYLDDILTIVSQIHLLRAASWVVHQRVMRDGREIARADITVAFLSPNGRPTRQPRAWTEAYKVMLKEPV